MNFENIITTQRDFFKTQKTKSIKFRRMYLEKLKSLIIKNEGLLYDAIYKDFGKSKFDTFTTEISFIIKDIDYSLKHLDRFASPKKVNTNLVNQVASSKIYSDPLGCVLVIGAWNYPYQLSLSPIVAAMAAGNCCILKPSEIAYHTMKAMAKMINENFPSEYLFVAEGGVEETTEILKHRFDKIFFTGSTKVGKIVYEAAAKHLTPVTLELGGKSPVIVTENANFEVAAKRIVWGKFLNGGQTCVAPDYVLADRKISEKFLEYLKIYIKKFDYQPDSDHYTRIINERNFDRLTQMIDPAKVYYGGNYNRSKLYIEPTLLSGVQWEDAVMQEEIFGPILPVLEYDILNEALNEINDREKPLAAYFFSDNDEDIRLFTEKISFGGGCINDVVMHLSNDHLPFGGVGSSGIGHYHGKYGFETFSHQKSVMKRATWGEPNFKYPPYSSEKLNWIKKLI